MVVSTQSHGHAYSCRSYCGNLTVDYSFALQSRCGHPGYRDLLFCINDVLMLHISSGSYRILDIDYAYQSLALDDPHMSTCGAIVLGRHGNSFVVEPWPATYLQPTSDNVFMLLGCSAESQLFQGFPAMVSQVNSIKDLKGRIYPLNKRQLNTHQTEGPTLEKKL
nr:uncharacterized protein LOC109149295 isoform X2 [Ipomoea batatas]